MAGMILFFLLAALRLSSCQTVTSVQPETPVRILPEDTRLNTFTFLTCNPEPNSELSQFDYVSRWIIPSGETFTYLVPNPRGFERYRIVQGPADGQVQRESTLLFMEMLTYQDAGNYTCEVRSSVSTQSPWFSASIELQLGVNLQTNVSNVTAHTSDSSVELECEMTLYIRADGDLQWFRGSEMIASGTDRYTISYRNGLAGAAQNGGNVTVPGRVSVLTISNPQLSDSGTYTCRLLGTEQSVDIQLSVERGNTQVSGTTHSIILSPSASRLHPPTQTRLQTTNINDERQMDAAPELATVISLTHVQTQFIPTVLPSMTVDVLPTDSSPMVFSSMTVDMSPTDGSPMVFPSMTADVSPTDGSPMVFSSMTVNVSPTDGGPMVFPSMTVDVLPTDSSPMVFSSMTVDVSPTDGSPTMFPSMTVDVSPTDSGPMVFPSVTMETLATDSVSPSMTVDVSPTDVGPILFTPNISPTDRGQAGSRRLLLILGGAILGPLVLVVFMVIAVTIACFVCRRKKTHSQTIDRSSDRVQNIESPKPLYAEVFEPVAPEQTADSLVPASHEGNSQVPEPHEILAYDTDIPETFRPFAPPPPVTGVKNGTNHQSRANVANTYDIPRAVYNDSDTPDWRYHNRGSAIRLLGNNDPYYDQVETVHNDLRASTSLTSSLQLLIPSTQSYQDNVHTLPAHFKSAHRSKRRESPDYDHVYNEALEPSMLQNSVSSDGSEWGLPFAPIYDVPKPLKKSEELLQISRQKIVEIRNLGVGRFGKVVLAATVGVSLKDLKLGTNDDRNRSILVAIKKLREDADSHLKDMFEQEIKFMTRLKNANVVRLLGVCKGAESFLMMEYMENGDLHEFLQKQKLVSDSLPGLQKGEITPLIQLYMAVQIASGMRYLASMKFVHRDLAARNCLVGRDFVVKISDFGMSRKLYDSVYYRIRGHLILPIRWMANESFYGKFSVKSDVWSFGITVWEIFTLAQNEPYHEMTDEELIADAIKEEGRKLLPNPSTCPKDIYDILLRCWVHEPLIRADFEEVYSRLFTVYTKLSKQAKRHTSISMQ